MSNLIPLEKAAAMLGVSVDRLTEMRSNNEIFGYRDGTSWKFKLQELERVADELGITLRKAIAGEDNSDDFELSDSSSGSEPMLLDEDSEELILDDSSDSGVFKKSSGRVTDEGDEIKFGDSSLDLAAESSKKLKAGDSGKLAGKKPGSSKKLVTGEDEDDELRLADVDQDDLLIQDKEGELSSDFEDSDLVLDDSDSETEMPIKGGKKGGPGDSAKDFALSDDALELGGSDIDSLELSDDGDMISLADAADADAATMMQEDDFNLTPIEGGDGDESSGSQVIALEDSDLFSEESAETQLALGAQSQQPGLISEPVADLAGTTSMAATTATVVTVPASDAPFSGWQILSLALVMLILVPGGMIAYDVCRNLWMAEGTPISSGVLPMVLELFQ